MQLYFNSQFAIQNKIIQWRRLSSAPSVKIWVKIRE